VPRKRFARGDRVPVVQVPLEVASTDDLATAQNAVAVQVGMFGAGVVS
jgi:hypothetical protein